MKIREIKVKSIIVKSNLPESDYVINPYVGCSHSCIYCYARFIKRFTNHDEPWGDFIDIKINAAELVSGKLDKYRGKSIFLSSVTDPYLPLEIKYQLTRKVLEKLIPVQPKLSIQTKSNLVLRDIDLLKQFKDCEVGLTITTLDDCIRQEIEPGTSSVEERLKALSRLHQEGIATYVFIGPILPFFTDWKMIIKKTRQSAGFYMLENLSVRGNIWYNVERWLKKFHPQLLKSYQDIYFKDSQYWDRTEKEIKEFGRKNNLELFTYFHHEQ